MKSVLYPCFWHQKLRFFVVFGCWLVTSGELGAVGEPLGAFTKERFGAEILPILQKNCFECHSHAGKKAKGGLVLDSRRGWESGGASGPAIVPGQANASLLVQAVRYEGLEMPPDGRLAEEDVRSLIAWIQAGAVDPRGSDATLAALEVERDWEAEGRHWAFLPLKTAPAPAVEDLTWPLRELDSFVLSALESAGIEPGADADAATWLRRVSFDLTGLPPTPEAVRAFLEDTSPLARERVVDRLLASRPFGERWARHWLDLVGYADQVGTSNNVFAEHAWRYRDYVIAAYNHDKPFDRFVREQIAGDLLPWRTIEERRQSLVATGFLVLGDLEIVEADKEKLLVDIADQQVSKVGQAFLGLTVGCARCHDHKFDPIPQSDYYALAGFFRSTSSIYKTDRGVWSDLHTQELPEGAKARAKREERYAAHFIQLDQWRSDREVAQRRRAEIERRLEAELTEAEAQQLAKERDGLAQAIGDWNRSIQHAEYFYPKPPMAHAVRDVAVPGDMRITIRGNPRALGEAVPRGFLRALGGPVATIPEGQSGRKELADWIVQQPLAARVVVNRVWQKLFGEGLVRTVDYFGLPGDRPSHPALLDYLAHRFVREGGSQKQLIRELVLSRAYGLASASDAASAERDPENRLLWRMNAFRLDAEALRDAMIQISGTLLPSVGGPAMPLEYPENVGGLDPKDVNPRSFRFSKWRPWQMHERTVYLPVIRHAAQPGPAGLRNVFDFAQPSEFTGKRATTAVPTQALYLMNGDEVAGFAAALAADLVRQEAGARERVQLLWLTVLNRPVTPEELAEAIEFLSALGASGWKELCHAVLASNEFLMRI